ncbi:hypothetical protein KPH14_010864 [Odynerus spinipes]|uniref:TROVE domain-containing protein n=1 Tax=Odynerus spinipes TaxID=1348599 RepID=A0AAD9RH75_9HYME|nr:hypothetical protein KPH14_010864 [Odynerus spinipes]
MDAAEVLEVQNRYSKLGPDMCSSNMLLTRFLYVGDESPVYFPKNVLVGDYFSDIDVLSIEALATYDKEELMPIEIITKAFESNLVPHPETLIFALAVCCKQKFSKNLRCAAYAAVEKICLTPEHFILFIKFITQVSKYTSVLNNKPTRGWGHGLRKAVNNWYLSKEPLELVKCVTRCKSRYGWKHKDIIKLSHPHPDTSEQKVILKYIMHGLEETKKAFDNNPDVKELIEYIQKVEDFKHCEDETKAASLLEKYEFTLDHVPGHMLKSTEVWNSLILSMDLHTLLNNLQRIHNLGLLNPDNPAVEKIIDEITNEERLSRDNIHPIFVYITLKNYENCGKVLSYVKRKMKGQAKKLLAPPSKPNTKIINALYQAFDLSIMNLKPTGLRYMITINNDEEMWYTDTLHSGNINGAEAGYLIAYSLSCCEKNVTVAAFDVVDLHIINLNQSTHFPSVMKLHKPTPNNGIHLNNPIAWALKKHNQYDVFINVIDRIVDDVDEVEKNFSLYRDKMNLPHAKLINCFVCSSSCQAKTTFCHRNILEIYGFDATVPMVIQAFSKSLF